MPSNADYESATQQTRNIDWWCANCGDAYRAPADSPPAEKCEWCDEYAGWVSELFIDEGAKP